MRGTGKALVWLRHVGHGNALHRIGIQWTQKVSATAARLIVQVGPRLKLVQHVDADNSRKLGAAGEPQIGRRQPCPLKTEKQSGPLQAGGSARPHCLCDTRRHSGTVARARQARGVRHCQSFMALHALKVYVGAAERRFGRFCSPALVCPDRSTGPDFARGNSSRFLSKN